MRFTLALLQPHHNAYALCCDVMCNVVLSLLLLSLLLQLIRIVYGAALNPGTFEEALTEFQHAVAINPNKLIHRCVRLCGCV